ncbi:hypothetical protein WA026_000743 [Henosepilachna vigintioctopunctata]|uniref:Uncharacterized protein n=1 Tax=Henosepilachna vigintioctopunctata TaxID=420089 RepID=A0AAW1UYK9_9CUCU
MRSNHLLVISPICLGCSKNGETTVAEFADDICIERVGKTKLEANEMNTPRSIKSSQCMDKTAGGNEMNNNHEEKLSGFQPEYAEEELLPIRRSD